jgi:hypothetical protein
MLDLWVPGGQPSKPRGWGTTLGAIEGGQDACRERSWPPPMALGWPHHPRSLLWVVDHLNLATHRFKCI